MGRLVLGQAVSMSALRADLAPTQFRQVGLGTACEVHRTPNMHHIRDPRISNQHSSSRVARVRLARFDSEQSDGNRTNLVSRHPRSNWRTFVRMQMRSNHPANSASFRL